MTTIRLTSIMSVKITHLWPRSPTGPFWFKRKVPKALVALVGKTWIQFSLGTRDPKQATRLIADHVSEQDREWSALLNPAQVPLRDQAHRLLVGRGTDPIDLKESEDGARWAFEELLEDQLPDHLREATEATPQELDRHLPPAPRAALQVYQGRKPFTLTDCMDQYIAARPSTEKDARLVFGYLQGFLGSDRDIRKVRRLDVNGFVAWLLAGGHASGKSVSTSTVRRYLRPLSAAFGRAIRENELGIENVFAKVEIQGDGTDVIERETFTVDQYRHLHRAIDRHTAQDGPDQLRCVLTLVAESGARLAEIVGLASNDVHLRAAVPYMDIREHPWRSLKTDSSTRKIPLTPKAQAAIQAALRLADGSPFLFPKYTSADKCKADSASAALVKWVRSREGLTGTKLGNHSLRHGMEDLLRAIGCPDSVRDQITGHKTPGMGANYGQGYPLAMLAERLTKATKKIHLAT